MKKLDWDSLKEDKVKNKTLLAVMPPYSYVSRIVSNTTNAVEPLSYKDQKRLEIRNMKDKLEKKLSRKKTVKKLKI